MVLAIVLAAAAGWWARGIPDSHWATPVVVEGWAYQGGTSGGIGCCGEDAESAGGHGYDVNNVHWRDLRAGNDAWQDGDGGPPDCLPAGEPARIRLGYVDIESRDGTPSYRQTVWLECW